MHKVLLRSASLILAITMFQQKWSYEGALGGGNHRLKLVFVGPSSGKVSLDAVSVP